MWEHALGIRLCQCLPIGVCHLLLCLVLFEIQNCHKKANYSSMVEAFVACESWYLRFILFVITHCRVVGLRPFGWWVPPPTSFLLCGSFSAQPKLLLIKQNWLLVCSLQNETVHKWLIYLMLLKVFASYEVKFFMHFVNFEVTLYFHY